MEKKTKPLFNCIKYLGSKLALIFLLFTVSAKTQCFEQNTAFQSGEILRFYAIYNWGFIWVNAGYVDFKVKLEEYQGKTVYHFDSFGTSHAKYDWIFKVRDYYNTYLDVNNLQPIEFTRKTSEGGFDIYNRYVFDYPQNRVFTYIETSKRAYTEDTLSITPCTYDVLSAIYLARNIDYSIIKEGEKIPIRSIIEDEVFNLYIRFVGREIISSFDGKRYKCIVFKLLLIEGTIFKGGEDLTVWVTDDQNKVPILVEAEILVGKVKAMLMGYEGLRHPPVAVE